MFSPAAAVSEADYETVKNQGKSASAENAVKLTVFKQDGGAPALEAPEVDTSEPVKRESTAKPATKTEGDVTDIVKKWSKKA